jgi:release factor glutamine methyltransferase
MSSVAAALGWGAAALSHLPHGDARREARLLLGHATGFADERLFANPQHEVAEREHERYATLVRRRAAREPMAHIIGRREFWSLDLEVSDDTLIPRPDSETLIEAALAAAGGPPPRRLLDLGTGSGCLLLALLDCFADAVGIGVDRSVAALQVAARNAARTGLADRARFVASDWGRGLAGGFDLVVSNPPYVARGDIAGLEPEVAHFEPRPALDGGIDGLDAYRALIPRLPHLLNPGGQALLEIGAGQADDVIALAAQAGLQCLARHRDLAGIERCLQFKKDQASDQNKLGKFGPPR